MLGIYLQFIKVSYKTRRNVAKRRMTSLTFMMLQDLPETDRSDASCMRCTTVMHPSQSVHEIAPLAAQPHRHAPARSQTASCSAASNSSQSSLQQLHTTVSLRCRCSPGLATLIRKRKQRRQHGWKTGSKGPGSRPSGRSAPALMMSSNNVRVQR